MNNFQPESLLVIAKQMNQEDVDHALAWKAAHGFSTRRLLFSLGAWMVASGEKLKTHNAEAQQVTQLDFLQNRPRKARA